MSKRRGLSAVPDPDEQAAEQTPPYTILSQFGDNAKLIRKTADENDIDPAVLVQLLGITLQHHLQKIQLGLTAPVVESPE